MGIAYVGYHPHVGLGYRTEALDLSQVRRTHLYDSHLAVSRHGQQCQRHTYMVVKVALGGPHPQFLRHHGGGQLLGGGLAVAAGHSDDLGIDLATPYQSHALQCHKGVAHNEYASVAALAVPLIMGDNIVGTVVERLYHKVVAVEVVALKGDEHNLAPLALVLRYGAAVGGKDAVVTL